MLPLPNLGSSGTGATSRVSVLDLEFDLDSNAETGKRPALTDADIYPDLEAKTPAESARKDQEPVTMSEVGTKLDLARAYIDMGDPDGARSILREVLQEGSANQRQEAQRLIDSIPG
jgi:pilus assembly protein FimV